MVKRARLPSLLPLWFKPPDNKDPTHNFLQTEA